MTSATYFEWSSFLNALAATGRGFVAQTLYWWVGVSRQHEDGPEFVVFRVWFRTAEKYGIYVGDRVLGPVNTWRDVVQQILAVVDWCNVNGFCLELGTDAIVGGTLG
jgi:hypothetical protein